MKKLRLFFVAMLLSAVAINSYAQLSGDLFTSDGIQYKITNPTGPFTVTAIGSNLSGEIEIPSTVDYGDKTYTVTKVDGGGIYWANAITNIKLPNTINEIGVYFLRTTCSVTDLYIPASVTKITEQLGNCWGRSLANINVDPNNPNYCSVGGILYSKDMKTLISIPFNNDYTDENGVFTVPAPVEEMNSNVISYNASVPATLYSKLKKIVLPKTFKNYDNNKIHQNCPNLEAFEVAEDNPYYYAKDGVLFEKPNTLKAYPQGKTDETYQVPDGVETVAENAFYYSQFKDLDLNEVSSLPQNAVNTCKNLKTLTIPAGLTELTEGAVFNCNNLTEYKVKPGNPNYSAHDGVLYTADGHTLLLYPAAKTGDTYTFPTDPVVTAIAASAFSGARYIKNITIPETVESVGERAFENSSVVSVSFPGGLEKIPYGLFSGCSKLASFTIPENTTVIGGCAFMNCTALKEIIIPEAVTDIQAHAFDRCSQLTDITIGKNVTTIGKQAFLYCRSLTNVTFEEESSLEKLDGYEFQHCPALETIKLPTSLVEMGANCFANDSKLKEIIVPDGSDLKTINQFGADNLEKLTFEGSCELETIGSGAFINHQGLTSLELPSSVKSIGSGAFKNCQNLESITFVGGDAQITTIGAGAFAECGLKSFDVPNNVQTISREAFRHCDVLEVVNLPATARDISPEAFKSCASLTAINVDKANTTYSSCDGILLSKDKTILRIFPEGKANSNFTLLPPSITTIGDYAFYENSNLTNVTIPNKVTKINKRSFGLCSNLNTVTFLCDAMIDPANINQAQSTMSFDDGTQADDMFGNITIYVRKELADQYRNNEFYQKFKGIETSFIDETTRVGGLNKTKAKEEFIAVSQNTVDLLSVDTEDETYVLPTTVKQGNTTYNVGLVGDYLFTANGSSVANVKEVVVPGNVEYIGARAFMTDAALSSRNSTVESVFLIGSKLNEDLLSTARFELTPEDLGSSKAYYDEFGTGTKIYVRKSAEETYKTAWTNYTDNISYKIPYTQNGTFGTFAREFDVDFSEVNGVNANKPVTDDPVLIAFTGNGKYVKNGDDYSVLMTSINLGDQEGKDGTYVPAGSGVLMKKYKEPEGEDGLYYQIAETGISDAFVEGNFMKGITLRSEKIGKSDGYNRYYISGGKLHEMTKETTFGNHKSFLEIATSNIPAGAKVSLTFTDWNDIEATSIESINANVDDNDNLYNLQGQRVNNAGKGIYIKNGKKIFVK